MSIYLASQTTELSLVPPEVATAVDELVGTEVNGTSHEEVFAFSPLQK